MFSVRLNRILTAGSILLALGGAAIPTALAAASPARPAVATTKFAFFEKNSSFKQTPTRIEFTDYLYVGNERSHARSWTGTDHFLCTFSKAGVPHCEGQEALGDSMILIQGRGGLGTFSIPVVGGTGRFLGARGTLDVHDIAHSNDANLTVTLSRM